MISKKIAEEIIKSAGEDDDKVSEILNDVLEELHNQGYELDIDDSECECEGEE